MRVGKLSVFLTGYKTGETGPCTSPGQQSRAGPDWEGCWGSLPQGHEGGTASGMASSDTSQAQIQGFKLAHPNIYPIEELLEFMKSAAPTDPKLQNLHNTGQQQDI